MAKFLTTKGMAFEIENIISETEKKLFIVSPYLKISKTFYERIMDIEKRGATIKLVFGKTELDSEQENILSAIKHMNLYFCENLHAKCYFNEKKMVIGSMNMYEFSEQNNREMGVLIEKSLDREVFEKAINEVESIINASKTIALKEKKERYTNIAKEIPSRKSYESGFCIRCGTKKEINPYEPYCRECYSSWVEYGNRWYEEKYCHICKKQFNSTIDKPLCNECYRSNSF